MWVVNLVVINLVEETIPIGTIVYPWSADVGLVLMLVRFPNISRTGNLVGTQPTVRLTQKL
jgi:hypothetical protein